MSTAASKLQKERNQKTLLELAALPGNNICADCKARLPRWASQNLGIFICVNCASIHRKIGTHITKVKSLTMDDWTKDQVEHMKSMGNRKSNAIYNPNELKHPPPPNLEDSERDSEIEQYIRAKYEYRKFIDRSALVASKLGPSRSATMMSARSVSSPTTQVPASSSSPIVTATDVAASSPIAPNPPKPTIQPRPPPPCPMPQNQAGSASAGISPSVWDDINSLASGGQNSSLPLQYASQPAAAVPTGAIGTNGYPVGVTSLGMGVNPFQPQQMSLGANPFSQQQSQSPFVPSSPFSAPPNMASSFSQPQPTSFGQQYFSGASMQPTTPMMTQPTSTPSYFQPQASSMQVQVPTSSSFLSPSPSQPFMSAPPSQSNFLTPSPSQQFNGSPQPQLTLQQPQTATQPQFMSQSPVSAQPPFLGMTTMQMQQQQLLMQQQQQQQQLLQQQQQQQQLLAQQQQQQQPQFGQNMFTPSQPQMMANQNGMYGQMYGQSGFPTQVGGQQWGAM
ncbi:hypothetical protein NLJ89_g6340 [Agrocybe chaxingu]|uniref:Arf-GAP domain-containing protein n=1 Tax=Agrocybe chaxingu TaxID=84603 RepID=A0A9W8MUR0_9AGAR|nr:hypothetical protein NLJ89_g6340 [Agrocybe chaxingu]